MFHRPFLAAACSVLVALAGGCYGMRPSPRGAQATPDKAAGDRPISVADIALPPGYRIEPVATGLTFPTGVTFDDAGRVYVVEAGYSYGEAFATPSLLRVDHPGVTTLVAAGGNNGPWTGAAFHGGAFYVAEGGV